ncbi:NUDIX hydrolase [Croceicoccus sp. F390]|uniref:NUDIX hydrolase n=1 Tax=Croceicoccus esteveae TaxID=3075597 RepID=A0ABU2ZHK5_9SPHN|nr:NUDIX hydrolase [Croceicoccus sp. F390]MDT0576087.1 NUDIX hydrolase [Croceicoccus sp. F390]
MSSDEAAADAILAATLIVCRRGRPLADGSETSPPEILMVKRAAKLRFAGGAVVFPGGRVDPGDHAVAARFLPGMDPAWGAALVASIRETLEEAGLLVGLEKQVGKDEARAARMALLSGKSFADILDASGWSLTDKAITPYARWCPPEVVTRVFDTHFFVTDIGTGNVAVVADGSESESVFWATAEEILRRSAKGELALVHPTRRNLQRIAQFTSFADIHADALAHPPRLIRPYLSESNGKTFIGMPRGHGYPEEMEPFEPI